MAHSGNPPHPASETASKPLSRAAERSQVDFELELFGAILKRAPDYVDVLRHMSKLLTLKGRYEEGLQTDRRLVHLCPNDPLAHYNLACRYSRLKLVDQCFRALRRALELGYDDFHYMSTDSDLEQVRDDPRFQQLLREHQIV